MFRDIERENQLILRAAGEGIYGVNAEGMTTFVNPAAERMLGWTADELVGKDMHATVHHTHPDGAHYPHHDCPIYAAFRDGAVHQVDTRCSGAGTARRSRWNTPRRRSATGACSSAPSSCSATSASAARPTRGCMQALAEVDCLRERLELENAYLQEEIRLESHHQRHHRPLAGDRGHPAPDRPGGAAPTPPC